MKRIVALTVMCVLVLSMSVSAAARMNLTGAYLLSLEDGTKLRGFSITARGEVYKNILLDGAVLSVSDKEADLSERLLTAGVLYRVVTEPDLQVFAGLGYAHFTSSAEPQEMGVPEAGEAAPAERGSGIFGKVGFDFTVAPKVNLQAALAYAPKLKLGEEDSALTTARAMVGYQLFESVRIQAQVEYYRLGSENAVSRSLVGGGIAVSF